MEEQHRRRNLAALGGLLGFSIVAVVQMVSMSIDAMDYPLKIAIVCFAIAIPQISAVLLQETVYRPHDDYSARGLRGVLTNLRDHMVGISSLLVCVALGAIFWHFSFTMLLVFAASAIVAVIAALATSDPFSRS